MSVPMVRQFGRIKPTERLNAEGEAGGLKRSMGLLALTMFSVGSIVGTGIFVILGEAVPKAGPAVVVSFVLAAVTCGFSAFSYAELAGSIPVSGSSYSYTYATLGELIAWIVGWCLMLEYGVSVAAVAVGWGQYLNDLLAIVGLQIPSDFANPPSGGAAPGIVNGPAILVVVLCTILLLRGASESAVVNTILVFVKIGILLLFCAVAFTAFDAANFMPFVPLGMAGISAAAAQVFFSYIGFDAASTAGEEARNPRRDLPRAILASLVIVTILYVVVAGAAIGVRGGAPAQWSGSDSEAVLSGIAAQVTGSSWAPAVISLGAVISIFSVVLVVMYGQTRIMFAMGRDGLLPRLFTKVNPRTQTPIVNTLIVAVVISVLAGFIPLGQLANATSIGTLTAFTLVNIGVIALWRTRPDLERSFRIPLLPLFPVVGALFCVYLVLSLEAITWAVFMGWMVVGLVIYLLYGRRHSNAPAERPAPIAASEAARALPTRSVRTSGIVGLVLLVAMAVYAIAVVLTDPAIPTAHRVLWSAVAVAAAAGAWLVIDGLRTSARGLRLAATDAAGAARRLRAAVSRVALGVGIPGLALILAVVFIAPEPPGPQWVLTRHPAPHPTSQSLPFPIDATPAQPGASES